VFTNLRTEALGGDSEGVLYVEFSAKPNAELNDRQAWREANPSFPNRTSERAILRLRKLLPDDDDFSREALGIWDAAAAHAAVPGGAWLACRDSDSSIALGHQFVLDVAPGLDWACIGVAGLREDHLPHVEITSRDDMSDHRAGTDWIIGRLAQLHTTFPDVPLRLAGGSAAEAFVPDITKLGMTVEPIPNGDMPAACGAFYAAATATDPGLRHLGQHALDQAVSNGRRQFIADKTFIWARRKSAGDITPLYMATLGHWAVMQADALSPINNIW
jgi:hypothetical protein